MLDKLYREMLSGSVAGRFLQVLPITCVVGILYAGCRYRALARRKTAVAWKTEIIRWLFVCYLTGLVTLVLVPDNLWTFLWFYLRNGYAGLELPPPFSGELNLVPTLLKILAGEMTMGSWVRTMLVGNLLMYLPMGVFLPLVFERIGKSDVWKLALIIPLSVEIIQPILGRSFDVDDLLLNFMGIVIGGAMAIKTT